MGAREGSSPNLPWLVTHHEAAYLRVPVVRKRFECQVGMTWGTESNSDLVRAPVAKHREVSHLSRLATARFKTFGCEDGFPLGMSDHIALLEVHMCRRGIGKDRGDLHPLLHRAEAKAAASRYRGLPFEDQTLPD